MEGREIPKGVPLAWERRPRIGGSAVSLENVPATNGSGRSEGDEAVPHNVAFREITWVIDKLRDFHRVSARQATHGILFHIDDQVFMINKHNPGSSQAKKYSVKDFIEAMTNLGWFQ